VPDLVGPFDEHAFRARVIPTLCGDGGSDPGDGTPLLRFWCRDYNNVPEEVGFSVEQFHLIAAELSESAGGVAERNKSNHFCLIQSPVRCVLDETHFSPCFQATGGY
jgi:hypothetical protein